MKFPKYKMDPSFCVIAMHTRFESSDLQCRESAFPRSRFGGVTFLRNAIQHTNHHARLLKPGSIQLF